MHSLAPAHADERPVPDRRACWTWTGAINCSYTSFEQCRATVSGIYGFCTPNPYPGTGYGKGGTWNMTPTSRGRSYRGER